ncbi:chemotaxis protein CheW [Thermodesulfobacteriota bacterium B35]
MLLLLFETGNGRFALDCREVVEIIPLIRLKKIPASPPHVAGIINYHSQAVPVIDLCALTEDVPCRQVYSTRIILVHYPLTEDEDRLVGLVAERVTDVVKSSSSGYRGSGVLIDEALNEYINQPGSEEMVQWFDIRRMLPRGTMEELLDQ